MAQESLRSVAREVAAGSRPDPAELSAV